MVIAEVKALIKKEIKTEWQQRYAFGGMLLYIASTVFVCKLSFNTIDSPLTWSALFWIIMLFAAVNAVTKSFLAENAGRTLYLYTLASAQSIIVAKIIYNSLLMLLLSVICFGVYALLLGNPVTNSWLFFVTVIVGNLGFASLLTMVSAIAAKAANNFSLMAILSFPIMLPLILTLIKLTKFAIDGIALSVCIKYLITAFCINIIIVVLAYMLFPYLWRD